jgi:hypothetical protein
MEQAIAKLHLWASHGEPIGWIVLAAGVALCFVVFNSLRILLYLPQLRTCLYVWIFWGDVWGLLLNLGNASMCAAVVVVTVLKRRRAQRCGGARNGLLS